MRPPPKPRKPRPAPSGAPRPARAVPPPRALPLAAHPPPPPLLVLFLPLVFQRTPHGLSPDRVFLRVRLVRTHRVVDKVQLVHTGRGLPDGRDVVGRHGARRRRALAGAGRTTAPAAAGSGARPTGSARRGALPGGGDAGGQRAVQGGGAQVPDGDAARGAVAQVARRTIGVNLHVGGGRLREWRGGSTCGSARKNIG